MAAVSVWPKHTYPSYYWWCTNQSNIIEPNFTFLGYLPGEIPPWAKGIKPKEILLKWGGLNCSNQFQKRQVKRISMKDFFCRCYGPHYHGSSVSVTKTHISELLLMVHTCFASGRKSWQKCALADKEEWGGLFCLHAKKRILSAHSICSWKCDKSSYETDAGNGHDCNI